MMRKPPPYSRFSAPRVLSAAALACVCFGVAFIGCLHQVSGADEGAVREKGVRALIAARHRETLRAVSEYISSNPQADDLEQAYAFAFETAGANGLEAEVIPLAEQFLARRDLDPPARQLAQTALSLGLARSGKLEEGMAQYGAYLLGARSQSPFRALDLAGSLSARARLAGNLAASREIYERLAAAYPLNAQIGSIVEGRIARQDLIGQSAPPVVATDTQGKPFDLASLAGRVVLVDFWATNCAPCLAEFPNLRQLHKDYGGRGFEIVGVSFDDAAATVEAFQSRARLPWRMVMNESPRGMISEGFRTRSIPALFLIGRDGKIAQVDVRGADLREAIEALLK
jgi:thiol-disulfide isomerase/thioredoxin